MKESMLTTFSDEELNTASRILHRYIRWDAINDHSILRDADSRLPLIDGRHVLIDGKHFKILSKMRWRWDCAHNNVVTGPKIHIHQFIVPWKRVIYRDGNKLNCREQNLADFDKDLSVRLPIIGYSDQVKRGVSLNRRGRRRSDGWRSSPFFYFMRKVRMNDGTILTYNKQVNFGPKCKFTTEESARKEAERIHAWIYSMSREKFISFCEGNQRNKKMNFNQALLEWDIWSDGAPSKAEIAQLGTMSAYDSLGRF